LGTRLFWVLDYLAKADTLIKGLLVIAPNSAPVCMLKCYLQLCEQNYEAATISAQQAVKLDPDLPEAMLYLIACLLTNQDYNGAGTYLGEINDRIDSGTLDDPKLIRFFKSQLARYNSRNLR